MKSTIAATCQAVLSVCEVWFYMLRVLFKRFKLRLGASFIITMTIMAPPGAASLPQQVTVNLLGLLETSSTTYCILLRSRFFHSLVFVKVEFLMTEWSQMGLKYPHLPCNLLRGKRSIKSAALACARIRRKYIFDICFIKKLTWQRGQLV